MRRGGLLVLAFALAACQSERRVVSRVPSPSALDRPKNLRPDPPPPAPLTNPAMEIRGSSGSGSPKADVAVDVSRASDEGIQVTGVCRYGETEVACWDPSGESSEALGSLVRSRLANVRLTTTFGRKNRLIVVATKISGIDLEPDFGRTGDPVPVSSSPGGGTIRFFPVAEGVRSPSTTLTFVKRSRVQRETKLALKIGATTSLAGGKLRVRSIGLSDPKTEFFVPGMGPKNWKVVVEPVGPRHAGVKFFPVDPFPVLLVRTGQRVSLADLTKGRAASVGSFQLRPMFSSALPVGAFAALMDRDPAKVKSLGIGAEVERRVRVEGIPLDPK